MKKNNTIVSVILLAVIMVFALACSNPSGGGGSGTGIDANAAGIEGTEGGGSIEELSTTGGGTVEYFSEDNRIKVTFPYLEGGFDGTFTDDTPLIVCVTNISSEKIEYATTGELRIEIVPGDPFRISWPSHSSIWTSPPYYWSTGLNRTYLNPGESCGFYIKPVAPGTTKLKIVLEKLHTGVTIPVSYN
jgi:hypothetical protein